MIKIWEHHFDEFVLFATHKSLYISVVFLDNSLNYLELITVPTGIVLNRITIFQNKRVVLLLKLDFEGGSPLDSILLFLVSVLNVEVSRVVDDFGPSLVSGDQLILGFRVQYFCFHNVYFIYY